MAIGPDPVGVNREMVLKLGLDLGGVLLIDETIPLDANQFSNLLQNYGVQTRPFFLGMHEQPIFKKLNIFKDEYFPVSTMASKKGLYLPSGLTLTGLQIKEVCIAVKEIMNGFIK